MKTIYLPYDGSKLRKYIYWSDGGIMWVIRYSSGKLHRVIFQDMLDDYEDFKKRQACTPS